jgi:hypothetical protein
VHLDSVAWLLAIRAWFLTYVLAAIHGKKSRGKSTQFSKGLPMVDPRDAELAACPNPWCISTTAPLPCALKREGWRVACACGVQTHRQPTEAEAIAAWNSRTRPEPLAGSGVAGEIHRRMRAYAASERGGDNEARQAIALADVIGRNERAILAALRAHPAPEQSAHCSGEVVEALKFYAEAWEQDVDAERTAHGWEGTVGPVEPSEELRNDMGSKARAALSHLTTPEKQP